MDFKWQYDFQPPGGGWNPSSDYKVELYDDDSNLKLDVAFSVVVM